MGTITKITLEGHEIRFERKSVGGVYQNVYIRHVGTNNRLTDAMHKANVYVESLFAIGLSRYATINEFKSFSYDENLRLQNEALAEIKEEIALRDRIEGKARAEEAVLKFEDEDPDYTTILLLGGAIVVLLMLKK